MKRIIAIILSAIQLICAGFLVFQIFRLNILPLKYAILLIVVLLVLCGGTMAISIISKAFCQKKRFYIIYVLEVIFIFTFIYGIYNLNITYKTMNSIMGQDMSAVAYDANQGSVSIVQMADGDLTDPVQLNGKTVGIDNSFEADKLNYAAEWISNLYSIEYTKDTYEDISELVNNLYDGTLDAIVIDSDRLDLMDYVVDTFTDDTKVLAVVSIDYSLLASDSDSDSSNTQTETRKDGNISEGESITNSAFVVFISGIDTSGVISTRSRSDTNIIMCVNPKTKKILMVSTPRDTYTPLFNVSGGVYDKLTHAGLYGPECSMGTLETIYDVGIDYYLRVNFTSVIDIVDALDGVDVYSDYSFTSKNVKGYSFTKGYNHVDGQKALAFCRERYSFSDGDRQRGNNHIAMIKAIINKCITPSILVNYADFISSLQGCIQTNMTTDELTSLIKMQLDDGASWTFDSMSLETTDSSSTTCYSMPGPKLYVGKIVESSQAEIQAAIKEFMAE